MGSVNLDAVADELYGLSLEDFIPTRTAREREMKAADNKELAAEIHRLPKPNVVAWLVNQLVREHYDDIQALLGLGSAMREATATFSGDRLRELSREQHEAIRRLVEHAKLLAHVAGRQVSDDTVNSLEETFRAAMADPGAADTVASGRLISGLHSTGFASLESTGRQQPLSAEGKSPSGAKERPRTKEPRGVEHRERAEARVAKAQSVVQGATRARDEAHATLLRAEQSVAEAGDRVEQLRRELHNAVEAQSNAKTERRHAQSELDRADRGAQVAQQRLTAEGAEQARLTQQRTLSDTS